MTMPSDSMDDNYMTLALEMRGPDVLLVTLNRPEFANAFNTQMARDLIGLFEGLALEARRVRVVVVTGAGDRAFCAGGDLKERRDMSDEAWRRQHGIYERMTRALLDCPLPIIGAINGAAYGGGCEIAGTFDFIYAAENARFCLPETSLGIMPGAGGTQTLSRAIGERRAKEMIYTGLPITAHQARKWGLVNAVYPQAELLDQTLKTAQKIAANAPISIRQAKQAIHRGAQMSLRDALAFEIEAYNRTIATMDRREGVRAFNERRKAEFKNQ